jgi:Fe-S-cluster-containing dehydrogenase component
MGDSMARILKADNMNKCIGCFTCMLVCAAVNEKDHMLSKSAIRVKTTGGLGTKFIARVCSACTGFRACVAACPTGALKPRDGGGVVLDAKECIGCEKCVDACTVGAVNFNEQTALPIICKYCGACAKYCPHDCLKMEER